MIIWYCCSIFNLILFRYVKDGSLLHHLGQKMEDLIFNVADSNFFFNDLEECDQVNENKSFFMWNKKVLGEN